MAGATFRILEHTADVRLRAWGDSVEELLGNAVRGAMRVAMGRAPAGSPAAWHPVEPWPETPADQAVAAVNEALFLLYARGTAATALRLSAGAGEIGVVPLPSGKLPEREVKAATYHRLAAGRTHGRWRVELILDL